MQRRDFIALLGTAFSSTFAAHAQQQTMPVIGYLSGASGPNPPDGLDGLYQGLSEGGYVRGRNRTSNIVGRRASLIAFRL